jgi:hypothetical protein
VTDPNVPTSGPQLLREYARVQDFHRQALELSREGWHPVAVTPTRVPFMIRAMNVLSLGLFSVFAPVEPSLLVTYSTRPE